MSKISIQTKTELKNGVKMPLFGLGVFMMSDGKEVKEAVKHALKVGYRSIDTAAIYHNEIGVGQAILESNVDRSEIFLTTKLWNTDQGFDSTLKAFDASLKKLNTDYLDLYLVHWPVKDKFVDTYKALERLYKENRVKAIGVSNFLIPQLKELLQNCEITPMVNQVEFHPLLQQNELQIFCHETNIKIEAWRPIIKGQIFDVKELELLAKKYNKSIPQIALRWEIQKGIIVIPKSVNKNRIEENATIFDFELSEEDIKFIDDLNQDKRTGPDPMNFDF